jgi:hypothetical protein
MMPKLLSWNVRGLNKGDKCLLWEMYLRMEGGYYLSSKDQNVLKIGVA